MRTGFFTVLTAVLLGIAFGPAAQAQFSNDGQVVTISGITNNWVGSYVVGSTNSFTRLIIENGGVLNSGYPGGPGNSDDYIGLGVGADHNSALVTGSGSVWSNNDAHVLFVGFQGSDSSLIVSNGGTVYNPVEIGRYQPTSNNTVVVTGTNSTLNYISGVGVEGPGNSLVISDGGVVYAPGACVVTTSSNSVLVSDAGSALRISGGGGLDLGGSGSDNRLVITNGGVVRATSESSNVGSSGSRNTAVVTGTGSVWSNVNELLIGNAPTSTSNQLVIADGGSVVSSNGYVGFGGHRNVAQVTGSGSVWTNDWYLMVGAYYSVANQLVVTNGGKAFGLYGAVGYSGTSDSNIVTVTGLGSEWSTERDLTIGGGGVGCLLSITGGGKITDGAGTVGSSSSNNVVLVSGPGSVWNNRSDLTVGGVGRANQLIITNSGTVFATNLVIGASTATCDNSVKLAGGVLYVTNAAQNASLEVRDGIFTFSSGTLVVDTLMVNNPCCRFIHTGGALTYNQLVLDPDSDADGDGIPNAFDPGPFDPTDTSNDADGDGLTNLQEFLAGTDATNSASAFRITAITRVANTNILVTWTMGSGKTNELQRTAGSSGSFATNNFAGIFTVTNTVGTTTNYLDVGAATNSPARYYRIRLVP